MKNLFFLINISFLILFISCSSSDNNNLTDETNSLLLRKWNYVSGNFDGTTIPAPICSNGNRSYIEFLEPNVYKSYTWQSNNNCDYFLESSGVWTRSGILITIDYDQGPNDVFTIDELTATRLSFVTNNGSYLIYTSLNN
jgi:hypothetical protein